MSPKPTKRGFHAEDFKWFSEAAMKELRTAQEEVQWLLDRGYKIGPVVDFVGGHYQLSARQRTAIQRATSSSQRYEMRRAKVISVDSAKEGCLYIDGFNLIITIEVALSGSLVVLGNDGALRDLAGLRGTYSIIEQTDEALKLIGKALAELSVPKAVFFLDAPVSNSGRLKKRILEHAKSWKMPVEVELVPSADAVLLGMERVVTGDSVVLDGCKSWFNLSRNIVRDYIRDAWIISFGKVGE